MCDKGHAPFPMHGMDALMNHYFYIIDSKEMRRTDHKMRKGKEMRSEEHVRSMHILSHAVALTFDRLTVHRCVFLNFLKPSPV
jgi:hypothetical protein